MTIPSLSVPAPPLRTAMSAEAPQKDPALWQAAQKLEAGFLAEMLKSAGLGEVSDSFGGGAGEEQFASFLRQAQAEEMTRTGGIGLAESLYQSLKERENDR